MQHIADTGFVAGFCDPNDKVRNWARAVTSENPGPHLSCEPVLFLKREVGLRHYQQPCFLDSLQGVIQSLVSVPN